MRPAPLSADQKGISSNTRMLPAHRFGMYRAHYTPNTHVTLTELTSNGSPGARHLNGRLRSSLGNRRLHKHLGITRVLER